jgi:type IV pilus assembly protein PilV
VQAVLVRAADEGARLADGQRLADGLAQRMRANPVAMALPDAANPYLDVDLDAGAAATPAASCYEAACGPMQMASFDLLETAAQLAGRFPAGRLRVCRDAPVPDTTGLLPWDCTGDPRAPVAIKLGWRGRPGQPDAPAVFLAIGAGAP